ncbi:MAG: hypothetical protein CL609_12005 [Anaerolineaceae bacterium]|nr:hypothetical protein [Anaerolineaceae bacterium]
MFFLGVLGVFQVLFFPGILIKKFLSLPRNIFFSLGCIIGLSLITNYLFVFFLTAIGLFIRWLVLFLVVLELIAIIYLYRVQLTAISLEDVVKTTWGSFAENIRFLFPTVGEDNQKNLTKIIRYVFVLLFFIIGIIAIEWIFRFFRYNLGEVFNTWDAVVSWNRWAVDWSINRMPINTQDYPQLIPANWAMIYKILGTTEIQFFAKAIMPLFSFLIMLLLLGLGFYTKNPAFFLAIELTRLIIKKFIGEFISAGYVDLALTFLVFLAFIMLFLAYKEIKLKQKLNYVFLSLIFVSGSVVTKQPGFYALASIGLMVILFLFRKELKTIFKEYKKQIFIVVAIMGVIILPWYLYKGLQIISGIEKTHLLGPLQHTNQVHNNMTLFANLIPGLMTLGKYIYVVLFLIPAMFFVEKFWKIISAFVVIPYIALWASYASYDSRNLTMMFPFIALLVCLGIVGMMDAMLNFIDRVDFKKIPIYSVFILIAVVAYSLNYFWTAEKLMSNQTEKQKQIFSVELNNALYDYFSDKTIQGDILTNYPVDYLPEFKNTQNSFAYKDLELFKQEFSEEEISYLLFPTNLPDDLKSYINLLEEQGFVTQIFSTDSWIPYTFMKINR